MVLHLNVLIALYILSVMIQHLTSVLFLVVFQMHLGVDTANS